MPTPRSEARGHQVRAEGAGGAPAVQAAEGRRRGRHPARPATQGRRRRVRAVLRRAGADDDPARPPGRAHRRDGAVRLVRAHRQACRPTGVRPACRAAAGAIADADPARGVAALNAAVERIARRDPAQYQWTYKRYTLRPPGSGERQSLPGPDRTESPPTERLHDPARLAAPAGPRHPASTPTGSRCRRARARCSCIGAVPRHRDAGRGRGFVLAADHRPGCRRGRRAVWRADRARHSAPGWALKQYRHTLLAARRATAWRLRRGRFGSARRGCRLRACSTSTSSAARWNARSTWPRWWCIPPAPGTARYRCRAWTATTPSACATASPASSTTMATREPHATAPTTRDRAACRGDDAEHRLHPMSWLFVLLQQLKQFIVPLVALLVFGRGGSQRLWPLIGVGVLVVISLRQYFTYRYGVHGDSLVVRSGGSSAACARSRSRASITSRCTSRCCTGCSAWPRCGWNRPAARSPRRRCGCCAWTMRSRWSAGPAARRGGAGRRRGPIAPTPAADALLALPLGEVLRLGLVSNRGLIVVGAAFAGVSQFRPRLIPNLFEQLGRVAVRLGRAAALRPAEYALAAVSLLALLCVLALRLLSMLLALAAVPRLPAERARPPAHGGARPARALAHQRVAPPHPGVDAARRVLHRVFKRRSLRGRHRRGRGRRTSNARCANWRRSRTPDACDALIEHLLPHGEWSRWNGDRCRMRSWWRLFLPGAAVRAAGRGRAGLALRRMGRAGAAVAAVGWYKARQRARAPAMRWATNVVAVRKGWWSRHWRFAEIDKLQALRLARRRSTGAGHGDAVAGHRGRRARWRRRCASASCPRPTPGRCTTRCRARWRGGRCAGDVADGKDRPGPVAA